MLAQPNDSDSTVESDTSGSDYDQNDFKPTTQMDTILVRGLYKVDKKTMNFKKNVNQSVHALTLAI